MDNTTNNKFGAVSNSFNHGNNNNNNVIADKIDNSFNAARDPNDRREEVRQLLQALAQEVAKIVEKLPAEKAEEAKTDLEVIRAESTNDKPRKKYWELSKNGIIDAAQAVGEIGKRAVELVTKLGPLLGF